MYQIMVSMHYIHVFTYLVPFLVIYSSSLIVISNQTDSNIEIIEHVDILESETLIKQPACQPLTIPMCKNLGYNMTTFPNTLNHDTQNEAGLEVHQFWPLVEIKCSPYLRMFLCSVYAPICVENHPTHLKVCRSVCEKAKAGCAPLMMKYGFSWPERMNCDSFPAESDQNIETFCVDLNHLDKIGGMDKSSTLSTINSRQTTNLYKLESSTNQPIKISPLSRVPSDKVIFTTPNASQNKKCFSPLVHIPYLTNKRNNTYEYNNNYAGVGGIQNCFHGCHGSIYFTDEDRTSAYYWVGLWSIFCIAISLTCLLTSFIDKSRFSYPQRPVIFIAICYIFISAGYLMRYFVGENNVTCTKNILRTPLHYNIESTLNNFNANPANVNLTTIHTTSTLNSINTQIGGHVCVIEFILIYYFLMSSYMWWIIFSISWLLSSSLGWGEKAINKLSIYFHLLGWFWPMIQTIFVILLFAIDGDPLFGVCFVGHTSRTNLLAFLILPTTLYWLIGSIITTTGWIYLIKARKLYAKYGNLTKMDSLVWRLGACVLCTVIPIGIVIACYLYEYLLREAWDTAYVTRNSQNIKPIFWVFAFKYFVTLFVGSFFTGVWVFSRKTFIAWKSFVYSIYRIITSPISRKPSKIGEEENEKHIYPKIQGNDKIAKNDYNEDIICVLNPRVFKSQPSVLLPKTYSNYKKWETDKTESNPKIMYKHPTRLFEHQRNYNQEKSSSETYQPGHSNNYTNSDQPLLYNANKSGSKSHNKIHDNTHISHHNHFLKTHKIPPIPRLPSLETKSFYPKLYKSVFSGAKASFSMLKANPSHPKHLLLVSSGTEKEDTSVGLSPNQSLQTKSTHLLASPVTIDGSHDYNLLTQQNTTIQIAPNNIFFNQGTPTNQENHKNFPVYI